ncbi:MAG: SprT-like domain-containing protein [Desulfamplus sp.]|nr:SprT-like domain-containing protein [Desulfamplus sp.]MBF0259050.1 SprT-like domain-containing protein [Desulfamplus sp.]
MIKTRYDENTIRIKRKSIANGLIKESANIKNTRIVKISSGDLQILFRYYDQIFFDNWFENNFKGKFEFSLSRRMTKSAGITMCPKNISTLNPEQVKIEIRMGIDFFFKYDQLDGSKSVCGIETYNSLEALQIVFEHEICHALEFIIYNKSNCHAKRFKEITNNLFGHTDSHHKIPTNRQIASEQLGINVGDQVNFVYDGKKMSGIISDINKRATVMVKNTEGRFVDRHGNRYVKYYVPVNRVKF